jgi:SAM-dependent methyltransferase
MPIASQGHPLSEQIIKSIIAKKPMHRRFLTRAVDDLSDAERHEVEAYIAFSIGEGVTAEELADSYLTIVEDTFVEELRFRQTGRYRFSSFAEARQAVYDNHDYMRRYMIGLALSSFWWSNHTKMRRFFQRQLPLLASKSGTYREVGPGHGMYFLESMRHCRFESYEGIDISPTSVELTRRVINSGAFGSFPRARVVLGNFLEEAPLANANVLVMGEVLEHMEDPGMVLRRAYRTTAPDAVLFLTTCINAPAIDHLYNPGTIEALEQLFFDHGFVVQDRCIVPRDGATLDECIRDRLAINVAYVLGKTASA